MSFRPHTCAKEKQRPRAKRPRHPALVACDACGCTDTVPRGNVCVEPGEDNGGAGTMSVRDWTCPECGGAQVRVPLLPGLVEAEPKAEGV